MRAGGERGARQRPAAHPPGRSVLGHRRGADRAGRDLRFAAVPDRASNSGSPTGRAGCSKIPSQLARSDLRPARSSGSATKRSTMSGDLAGYLRADPDRRSAVRRGVRPTRSISRNLSEAIIFTIGGQRQIRTLGAGQSVRPAARPGRSRQAMIAELQGKPSVAESTATGPDRRADPARSTARRPIVYAARVFEPQFQRADRAGQRRARPIIGRCSSAVATNQLRFNAALLLGALIIVGAGDLHRAASSPTAWSARSANWSTPPGGSRRATSPRACRSPRPRTRSQTLGDRLQPHDRAACRSRPAR